LFSLDVKYDRRKGKPPGGFSDLEPELVVARPKTETGDGMKSHGARSTGPVASGNVITG